MTAEYRMHTLDLEAVHLVAEFHKVPVPSATEGATLYINTTELTSLTKGMPIELQRRIREHITTTVIPADEPDRIVRYTNRAARRASAKHR